MMGRGGQHHDSVVGTRPSRSSASSPRATSSSPAGPGLEEVCRHLEIAESTWHRWLTQYGGMKANDAKRLKELEGENARLKKLVAEPGSTSTCSRSWPRETSDPEPPPPRRQGAADTVRGLRTAGLRGGRPAPLHPAARPADRPPTRSGVAGLAAGLRHGAGPAGDGGGPPRRPAEAGWRVNDKRIQRLWREEGLRVPYRKRKKPSAAGSVSPSGRCPRSARTSCGRWTSSSTHRRRPHLEAAQRDRRVHPRMPRHRRRPLHRRRSGRRVPRSPGRRTGRPRLRALRQRPRVHRRTPWPTGAGSTTSAPCSSTPARPWQNAWIESFNGRLRDELLNG